MRVGEAVKQIPLAFREATSHVAWREMAGFRDILVHDYDGVDLSIVLYAATVSAPIALKQVQDLLAQDE